MEIPLAKDLNATIRSPVSRRRLRKAISGCKVCGAPAFYAYAGVLVCPCCKIFFKRSAVTKRGYLKCSFDGNCEMDIFNRRICPSCRLDKCFALGMQTANVRPSVTIKKITPDKITVLTRLNKKYELQRFPTLNLLRSDQSILTLAQWNLLSNLTHCYDEYSGLSLAQDYLREQNYLPSKIRFKIASVDKLFTSILSGTRDLYEKNVDFTSLCSHDRFILLHNTMKYVTGLGFCFIEYHTRLLDNPVLYISAERIYGSQALDNGIRAIDHLEFDNTFTKLVLALLAFSTFNYTYYKNIPAVNLTNIKAVLYMQDMYTELTWNYLIYKYDHERAVLCFSNLIRYIFLLNDAIMQAVEGEHYNNMIDSFVKKTEETLILSDGFVYK